MSVCIYIHIYNIYKHSHTHKYIYVYIYRHICIHTYTQIYIHIYLYIYSKKEFFGWPTHYSWHKKALPICVRIVVEPRLEGWGLNFKVTMLVNHDCT